MSSIDVQKTVDGVNWNSDGLVPVIAQDARSLKVLMLAWMNREALQKTIECGDAVYWSRSRGKLWRKGETSGHTQRVSEIRLDCDSDTLLLLVDQAGGIACHTGRESCLYRRHDGDSGDWATVDAQLKQPEDIYGDKN